MSVYIKGIEKPKDCWMCNFVDRDYGNCLVDGKEHGDYNKPENCPLVPVPEHGRLIDKDAVMLDGGPYEYNEWCEWALDQYQDAPTIIPADKEEQT